MQGQGHQRRAGDAQAAAKRLHGIALPLRGSSGRVFLRPGRQLASNAGEGRPAEASAPVAVIYVLHWSDADWVEAWNAAAVRRSGWRTDLVGWPTRSTTGSSGRCARHAGLMCHVHMSCRAARWAWAIDGCRMVV